MYPNDKICWECGEEWNSKDYFIDPDICPRCGTDSHNPVPYFYPENERQDIIENIRDEEWIKNVDIYNLIIEKIKREKKLKQFESQMKTDYWVMDVHGINPYDEIVKYFEEKYNCYNLSILNIKFVDVAREIELKHRLSRDQRNQIAGHAINVGLKVLAQHRLDELYDAMKLRKDKGIDINCEMKIIKSKYSKELEFEIELKCYKLTDSELEKIKKEKIQEMNEDLEKIRLKIIDDLKENNITNFTGIYTIIDSSIGLSDYVPCESIGGLLKEKIT